MNRRSSPAISVIIPVYYETARIAQAIADIRRIDGNRDCEIIVVDGAPDSGTIGMIAGGDVTTIGSRKGRAVQMNAGAAIARGRTLLFLHADTRLPDDAIDRIRSTSADERYVGGAFSFAYDSDRTLLRVFGRLSTLRCRLTRLPFGDQAIFLDRDYFFRVGRFLEVPLMEDVDLVRRIKRRGDRLKILRESVRTSPRRIEEEGMFYSGVRCALLLALYAAGVSPERLKRYYPDRVGRGGCERPDVQSPVSNRVRQRQRV